MIKFFLTTITIFLLILNLNAQDGYKIEVFEGQMNDKMPITLYLQSEVSECTNETVYTGMYKYNGVSNWLQLRISNNSKMQFCMVEYRFTGVMILTKTNAGFTGVWISPDSTRQLKVELKKATISKEKINALEDSFEELNYENNDC